MIFYYLLRLFRGSFYGAHSVVREHVFISKQKLRENCRFVTKSIGQFGRVAESCSIFIF